MAYTPRPTTLLLVALLGVVQVQLWFGDGGLPYVAELRGQVGAQTAANEAARERNQQIQRELADLREGLEMVEETARAELGMVRPNEVLVHVSPSLPPPAAGPAAPAVANPAPR